MSSKAEQLAQQYKKEYTRLRKGFYRYNKEGFTFPTESIVKNPVKVTPSMLQSIQQIKPKQLTKIAEQIDLDTGEIIQKEQKKQIRYVPKIKIERKKPTKLPKLPDISTEKVTIKPQSKVKTQTQPQEKTKSISLPKQITIPKETVEPKPIKTNVSSDTDEYIPTLSIIDAIRDRIEALPDVTMTGRGVPIGNRRNALLDIVEDTLNSLPDEDDNPYSHYNAEYEKYLSENQDIIFRELDIIKYESKDEKIDASFALVARILNYGKALTALQSESINAMQEMF